MPIKATLNAKSPIHIAIFTNVGTIRLQKENEVFKFDDIVRFILTLRKTVSFRKYFMEVK